MSKTETPAPKGTIITDPELACMNAIAKAYAKAELLAPDARGRVKQWAFAKFQPLLVPAKSTAVNP